MIMVSGDGWIYGTVWKERILGTLFLRKRVGCRQQRRTAVWDKIHLFFGNNLYN